MAPAAISVTAEKARQQCYDALTPDEKTAVLFAMASAAAAAAQVRP